MSERNDPDRARDAAERRKRERAEQVEEIVARATDRLEDHDYPTTSEELATAYAGEPLDLPNETESLGSVFDRLVDERYESPAEAREAIYRGLTGPAGPDQEYNEERDLDQLDEAVQGDLADRSSPD